MNTLGQTHLNSLVSFFTVCYIEGRQYLIKFPCRHQGVQNKESFYGDNIIPIRNCPQNTEIFNTLVKHTKTSNPNHCDLIMNLLSTPPSCPSSGRKGTIVFQLDLDDSHPTGSIRCLSGKLGLL